MLLFWLALVSLLALGFFLADMCVRGRHIAGLASQRPWPENDAVENVPSISLIIPARDEERNLADALRSMLAQDYPRLEILLINDRSTDRTGAIMREFAAGDSRIRVIDITELPPGWLGKNYALALGATRSSGELLLFADADIIMEQTVIRRAVGRMQEVEADHVTIGPRFLGGSRPLRAFLGAFAVFFAFYAKPWRVRDPRSSAFIGIGAFNLVKRTVYEAVGTHQRIAMRPDDDMKLGKIIKRGGYRQEYVNGGELLKVEWYASIGEMIDGLMKNSFAGVDYSLIHLTLGSVTLLVMMVWPFIALFFMHGATFWLNLAICGLVLLLYALCAPRSGIPARYAPVMPFAVLLMIYIIWRAMFLTYRNGGIAWRGTHYPLAALKANKV